MPAGGRGWSLYISNSSYKNLCPRPLGGEGGPQPALSPAGAGRVRGSKPNDLNPMPPVATILSSARYARTTPGPADLYHWGSATRYRFAHRFLRACQGVRLARGMANPHGVDPLTRPAPAEENAGAGHPLPQGGEGRDSRLRPFSFFQHSPRHKCTNSNTDGKPLLHCKSGHYQFSSLLS